MKHIRTWQDKSDCLNDGIQDLLDYHLDNFSKQIIKDRFLEHLEKIKII